MEIKLKRIISFFAVALVCMTISAQNKNKFDPAKFESELETFIISQAELSQEESAKFLPIWREMRKKQLETMRSGKDYRRIDFNDETKCADAIRQHDEKDIKLKELQRTYHNKFLKVIPAGKVMRVIRAEDRFHKQAFKRVVDRQRNR